MIIRPAKHLYKCVTGIAVGILLVSSLLAPTAANAAPTSHTVTPVHVTNWRDEESVKAGKDSLTALHNAIAKLPVEPHWGKHDIDASTSTDPSEVTSIAPPVVQELIDTINPLSAGKPNYVAVGDSWPGSSLIGTIRMDPCWRNRLGYPEMIAVGTKLSLRNTSCAGAGLNSYWLHSRLVRTSADKKTGIYKSPMRDAIDEDTRLATIQLGLNEFLHLFCWYDRLHGRTEMQCTSAIHARFRTVEPYLEAVYEGIYKDAVRRSHPSAKIVAVGYNQMFNGGGPCWDGIILGFQTRKLVDELIVSLNNAARNAAERAHIPYYQVGEGENTLLRSACGIPYYRYIAGYAIVEGSEMLHPTIRWHIELARHIVKTY